MGGNDIIEKTFKGPIQQQIRDAFQYIRNVIIAEMMENDRIEIVSFLEPDCSVTIEGLKSFRVSNRRYRNRRIGNFLKELHLTEGRNTGFKKILDALEKNGSPRPEFETDEERSYFITRLFIHEKFLNVTKEEPRRSQEGAKKEPKRSQRRAKKVLKGKRIF